MRKQIFKAIADAVAAVPGVAFVDPWIHHAQTLKRGEAFALPPVVFDVGAGLWEEPYMGLAPYILSLVPWYLSGP